jgi:SAM-dependent methyltransferase
LNSTLSHRVGYDKNVADIYNQAADDYIAYADGDPTRPFAFDGMHAYADRCVWALLEKKLAELRASGESAVSFLDAGCGPGTWLRRLVIRASALGFTSITARGFDIAEAQIKSFVAPTRDSHLVVPDNSASVGHEPRNQHHGTGDFGVSAFRFGRASGAALPPQLN